MKKLFSLVAAALTTISMFASTIVITPENCNWKKEAGPQSGVVGSVTIACTQGLADGQIRIYNSQTLTLSSTDNITKIEFTCTAAGDTKYGPGCFDAQEGYSYEGKMGTWVGNAKKIEFKASANQVRALKIVVTTDGTGGDIIPIVTDTLTCAEAAAAAKAGKTDLVAVEGYVTEYVYKWDEIHPSVSFWMADTKDGGQVFQAYGIDCEKPEQGPALGDKVRVIGALKQFNEISEMNGGTFEILEANGGKNPNTEIDEPQDPILPEGYISVKQAMELAAKLADPTAENKTVKGEAVKVRGYVNFAYDAKEGKQSAWVSDKVTDKSNSIQGAYLVVTEPVAIGDLVDMEGTLAKYYKAGKEGKEAQIIVEVIDGTMKKATTDAIDNTTVVEKAVKVIENGQLVIIRNGVKYNAVGAVIE